MILVDYSQIVLASIFEFAGELKNADSKQFANIVRHVSLNSLVSIKRKYYGEYGGKFVIACDGQNYWRKDVQKYYKANRKKSRDDSDLDWDTIFAVINGLKQDIKDYFPWTLIEVDRCEADDVVAVLSKYISENEKTFVGVMEESEPVLIVSSDGDNQQCTIYDNVRQVCPNKKAYIPQLSQSDLRKFKLEHVIKGDSSDGIPNIFMPEDFLVNGEGRQKSVTAGILETFYNNDLDDVWNLLPKWKKDSTTEFKKNGEPKQVEETEEEFQARLELVKAMFKQNSILVLYDNIPADIQESILATYKNYTPGGNRGKVMTYLINNGCNRLLEDIQDF